MAIKASLLKKLEVLRRRHRELGGLLSDVAVIQDQNRFRTFSKEYADLSDLVETYAAYDRSQAEKLELEEMLGESDEEMVALARAELSELEALQLSRESVITSLLLPTDPRDQRNVFLEIRAGTGGQEAALFAADLYRMYMRFAERRGWRSELVSASESDQGGYKEVIVRLIGQGVFSQLKFESGAHRVQRVPVTESQGRVHTSACTVAVMAEADEIDHIDINPSDLRIDTFRASGAGGQHVNRTDSAVRITHLPTGVVIECQDERSQHKNKARAMSLLSARLLDAQQAKQASELAETRRDLVGSGDRSERIRTYNFPQGRVTDHRINLTLYQLSDFMDGEMMAVVGPLTQELQASQLNALGED